MIAPTRLGGGRIFVAVAARTEPDLPATIADIFAQANRPDLVRVGVCQLFDDASREQLVDWHGDGRVCVAATEAADQPIGWARARAAGLYDGEAYTLQIDGHTRLVPGWDDLSIAMLDMCDVEHPVLSCEPVPFRFVGGVERRDLQIGARRLCWSPTPTLGRAAIMSEPVGQRVRPGRQGLVASGFVFAEGQFWRDVPPDSAWTHQDEELGLALGAYTHGYDVLFPPGPLAWRMAGSIAERWMQPTVGIDADQSASVGRDLPMPTGWRRVRSRVGSVRSVDGFEDLTGAGSSYPAVASTAVDDPDPGLGAVDAPVLDGGEAPLGEGGVIQVLGLPNSGTTVLVRLIELVADHAVAYHPVCWKHSLPPDWRSAEGDRLEMVGEATFLCCTRGPYSWARSCVQRPYDLFFVDPSVQPSDRLRSPVDFSGRHFRHLMGLWTTYYEAQAAHVEPLGGRYVRLEEMVAEPIATARRLAGILGVDTDLAAERATALLSSPTKIQDRGASSFGEQARRDLRAVDPMGGFGVDDLTWVTGHVDRRLMARFGYPVV